MKDAPRWQKVALIIAGIALLAVMVLGFLSGPYLSSLFTTISTKLGG